MNQSTVDLQQNGSRGSLWRKVIGWAFLSIGFLGIPVPIIPGIPFLLAGLATLSTEHQWARALLLGLKRKAGKFLPLKFRLPRRSRRISREFIQPAPMST